jgi:hypothetical protein
MGRVRCALLCDAPMFRPNGWTQRYKCWDGIRDAVTCGPLGLPCCICMLATFRQPFLMSSFVDALLVGVQFLVPKLEVESCCAHAGQAILCSSLEVECACVLSHIPDANDQLRVAIPYIPSTPRVPCALFMRHSCCCATVAVCSIYLVACKGLQVHVLDHNLDDMMARAVPGVLAAVHQPAAACFVGICKCCSADCC